MDTSSPPPLHGPTMNYFLFCDTCDDYGDDGYYYYDHDDYDDFGDHVRDDGSGLFFWRRLPHSLMIHKNTTTIESCQNYYQHLSYRTREFILIVLEVYQNILVIILFFVPTT